MTFGINKPAMRVLAEKTYHFHCARLAEIAAANLPPSVSGRDRASIANLLVPWEKLSPDLQKLWIKTVGYTVAAAVVAAVTGNDHAEPRT